MQRLDEIIAAHAQADGPLLPILNETQSAFGYIGSDASTRIATALGMAPEQVSAVINFYPHFRTAPDPRPIVKICRAESCQALGVELLISAMDKVEDVRVETVSCLGLCSVGPAAMVGNEVIGKLDETYLWALIEAVR